MFEKIFIVIACITGIISIYSTFKPSGERKFILFILSLILLNFTLWVGPSAKFIDYNLWLYGWGFCSLWFFFRFLFSGQNKIPPKNVKKLDEI